MRTSQPIASSAAILRRTFTAEAGAIGFGSRHQLNPDVGHLVRRSPSPRDTRRADESGLRAFASELSKMYSISSLVPAGSQNGAAYRYWSCQLKSQFRIRISGRRAAVRQRRPGVHAARAVVRVRLDRVDLGVHRQHVRIGDADSAVRRRDVDVLPAQPEIVGIRVWRIGREDTGRSTAGCASACRSAAGEAARRGRCRRRGATRARSARAAAPARASSRENAHPGSPRSEGSRPS